MSDFNAIIAETVQREVRTQMSGVVGLIADRIREVSTVLKDPSAAPIIASAPKNKRGRPPGSGKKAETPAPAPASIPVAAPISDTEPVDHVDSQE